MLLAVATICTVIAIYVFLVWVGFLDPRHPSLAKSFWYILFSALAGIAWAAVLT